MKKEKKNKKGRVTLYVLGGIVALMLIGLLLIPAVTGKDVLITGNAVNVQPIGYQSFTDTQGFCGATIRQYENLGTSITTPQQRVLNVMRTLQSTEINCEQGFIGMVANDCHREYIADIYQDCKTQGYEVYYGASRYDWGYKIAYTTADEGFTFVWPRV